MAESSKRKFYASYASNADTFALEKQTDEMVYSLCCLTPEEIAIVEGKS